jgi:DNA (cytosine-5)-methyltransferase 1
MGSNIMNFRMGELFCGPGGISLGAHLANERLNKNIFRHGWAVDNHFDTCKTYIDNIPAATTKSVFVKDVRDLDLNSLSNIDGFAYGFPCNDFSLVGESKGFHGEFGPLYSYGVKVLDKFNPRFFIAENVGGITSSNGGNAFKKILKDLKNAGVGYSLTPHLYKFEYYGVPQTRHRVIVVGIRKDENLRFHPPAKINSKFITSKAAIAKPKISRKAHNHELTTQSQQVIDRLSYIKPGENAWNAVLPDHLQLNVKGAKLSQIYKRLHPDKPAYTITGSGGGGTHVYHWSENRALTNRERARLQTFPDDFIFFGNKNSVRRQVGMAVPPVGVSYIFEAIYKTFCRVRYEYEEQNIMMDF